MSVLYGNDRIGEHPKSWYAATARSFLSFPVLSGAHRADVCVIGAGFTGLSAAWHLAQKGYSVTVLDAHCVGFGASGRNGGQVGSGYNQSQDVLAKKMGSHSAKLLWDLAEEAKRDVRLFHDQTCDIAYKSGVASTCYNVQEFKGLQDDADFLSKTYGYEDIELLDRSALQSIVRTDKYEGGYLDHGAGHIHPLRYAHGLAKACYHAGVEIFERSEVISLHRSSQHTHLAETARGTVAAQFIVLAGNGYMTPLNKTLSRRVMPINSFIGATKPLTDAKWRVLERDIAVADSKFVVNYFRMSEDHRFIFGGRESYGLRFPKDIKTALHNRMTSLFPQLSTVDFEYVWGGTLAITSSRLPLLSQVEPNVFTAGGFSGHGVALSGLSGKILAEAISGQAERFDVASQLPSLAFPGGATFQAPLLGLAMTWYALRDKLGL